MAAGEALRQGRGCAGQTGFRTCSTYLLELGEGVGEEGSLELGVDGGTGEEDEGNRGTVGEGEAEERVLVVGDRGRNGASDEWEY